MNFNKVMIDTLHEIKKTQSDEIKPSLKLCAPNIDEILIKIYHQTENVHTKSLITIFMQEAGEVWSKSLQQSYTIQGDDNFISKLPNFLKKLKLKH